MISNSLENEVVYARVNAYSMEILWPECTAPESFKYTKNNVSKSYMEGDSRRLSNNKETGTLCFQSCLIHFLFIFFFQNTTGKTKKVNFKGKPESGTAVKVNTQGL